MVRKQKGPTRGERSVLLGNESNHSQLPQMSLKWQQCHKLPFSELILCRQCTATVISRESSSRLTRLKGIKDFSPPSF